VGPLSSSHDLLEAVLGTEPDTLDEMLLKCFARQRVDLPNGVSPSFELGTIVRIAR
jgi:hypothetical protein